MELSHNNAISMRYDVMKVIGRQNRELIRLKREEIQRKSTTESPERIYFCWFLSLKLILEMEERKLKFDGESLIGEYKIDREFYKEWNLDSLLHLSFNKWWEMYKTLFQSPPVVERDNLKDWITKPHYRYLRVDLRNSYTNIRRRVLEELEDLIGQKVDNKTKYPVIGKPQYDNEILKYNIMVRKINGESNLSIFESEINRFKVIEQKDKGGEEFEKKGLDGKTKILSESKLFGIYRNYMSLSPEEREISTYKVRRGIMDPREEEKYRLRMKRTLGHTIGKDLESILTREINRYVKNYKEILCGVSQGQYRKPIKL
jgi:hypothetical protein